MKVGERSLSRRNHTEHPVPSRPGSPGLSWPVSPTHTFPEAVRDTLSHPCLLSSQLSEEGFSSEEMPCHLVSEHLCGWEGSLFPT